MHGCVRANALSRPSQHVWSLHYYTVCNQTDAVHGFHVFESLLLRFVFNQNMFLPCRLYRDKKKTKKNTKHRYVIQTLACCLEEEKEKSNSHQLSGYLKMQITSWICLIFKKYIYIPICLCNKTLFLLKRLFICERLLLKNVKDETIQSKYPQMNITLWVEIFPVLIPVNSVWSTPIALLVTYVMSTAVSV